MRTCIHIIALLLISRAAYSSDFIVLDNQQRDNLGITTAAVKPSSAIKSMVLPALIVVPNGQLHVISSQQSGLITQLYVVEGDSVSTGQELVRIQSSGFLALQRDYLQLLSRFNLSKTGYNRARSAFREGVISEEKLLGMQSEFNELSAARDQKRGALILSGMSQEEIDTLEKSKTLVSDFIIRSPIDGIILEQHVSAGERIDAATAIYKVGNLVPLWAEIHVPLTVIENTKTGNPIYIPEYNIEGTIITIGKQVHDVDQGILVRAVINEGAELLRPGQFVQAQITTESNSNASFFEVDSNAIIYTENRAFVFVEKPDGFQPTEVSVIAHTGPNTIVSGSLQMDANIVITGTSALKAIMLGIGGEG